MREDLRSLHVIIGTQFYTSNNHRQANQPKGEFSKCCKNTPSQVIWIRSLTSVSCVSSRDQSGIQILRYSRCYLLRTGRLNIWLDCPCNIRSSSNASCRQYTLGGYISDHRRRLCFACMWVQIAIIWHVSTIPSCHTPLTPCSTHRRNNRRDRERLVPPTFRLGTNESPPPDFLAVVFKKQEISQQVVTRMQDLASEFSKIFRGHQSCKNCSTVFFSITAHKPQTKTLTRV